MMNKIMNLVFTIAFFCLLTFSSLADTPPDPGGGPGTGDPVGGGSPLGSGFIITAVLGLLYGTKKAIEYKRKQ